MPGDGWYSHKNDLYNQQQHGVELRQVDIRIIIFQGYPSRLLSPLLFIAVMWLLKVLQEMKAESCKGHAVHQQLIDDLKR